MTTEQLGLIFRTSRATQIYERFVEFHHNNPVVWDLFKRFTHEVVARGLPRYSAYAVFERIRWHTQVETKGEPVKLNDHYATYYARMFHAKFPEHDGFFETRKRTSENRDAYDRDIAVFDVGPASNETALLNQLRALA